jgi:hypothetical protein
LLAVRNQANTRLAHLIPHPVDAFETYGARNYKYMKQVVERIRASYDGPNSGPSLRKPYDGKAGVFPCRSFNLGGQAVTGPHVDEKNLAHSWCAITALGRFDPNLGGHLILWDFGLAVKFPPGSTILIPSALFVHSNASIQPGETRAAIVQFAAGGLFRWSEHLMTEKEWVGQATADDLQRHREMRSSRWGKAVRMFTMLEELMSDSRDNIKVVNAV